MVDIALHTFLGASHSFSHGVDWDSEWKGPDQPLATAHRATISGEMSPLLSLVLPLPLKSFVSHQKTDSKQNVQNRTE